MEVKIIKSTQPKKKYMAVFNFLKNGKPSKKTIHFGQAGAKDYINLDCIYYKDDGKKIADIRKTLYYVRHSKEDWTKPMTAGTLSKYILWFKPTVAEGIQSYIKKFNLNHI